MSMPISDSSLKCFVPFPFLIIFSDKKQKQIAGENCLNLFQLVLSDPNFATDYNRLHPVTDDIDTIIQVVPKL